MIRLIAAVLFIALFGLNSAQAQGPVKLCFPSSATKTNCIVVSPDNPLPITGSFSAAGFTPSSTNSTGTPFTATTGGATGTLPTGAVVIVSNVGTTNSAYCKLGASATTSDLLIAPNSWIAITRGAATQLTCATSTSTTTINMIGGSGSPTGAGGGGGGGSGGSVTITAPLGTNAIAAAVSVTPATSSTWPISGTVTANAGTNLNTSLLALEAGGNLATVVSDFGPPGAAACASDTASCNNNQQNQRIAQRITSLITAVGAPFQAGASIGNTTFAVTNAGTFAVQAPITSWGGGTLGAMANYGTSPGAVLVPGVNAYITNATALGRATPANSNPVVLPATPYETVAASQTGQALGATGGTGDYLSHCVIYPVTTSPGVVTVFDSTSSATNNVITFAGGSSSLSNLAPISIPVGAVSINGAWKVTTGTNVLAICYGNFT